MPALHTATSHPVPLRPYLAIGGLGGRLAFAAAAPSWSLSICSRTRRERPERSAAMGMVIGGIPVEKDDVFIVVNKEGPQKPNICKADTRREIETYFKPYDCVILEAKNMPILMDYFGGLWTEGAQYKISRVKKWCYRNRYTYALAYKGDLMHALKHVNRYLGGHITFISDDFKSFVGPHVETAGTDEKRPTGHSGRCFIVGLAKFST